MNLWNFLRRRWVSFRRVPSSIKAWMSGIIFIHQRIFAIFKIFRSLQLRLFYILGTERNSVFCFYTSLYGLFLVKQFHIVCRTFYCSPKYSCIKESRSRKLENSFIFPSSFPYITLYSDLL